MKSLPFLIFHGMNQSEIDKLSIEKAKTLFLSGKVYQLEVGTTAGLQAITMPYLRIYILLQGKYAS